MINQRDLCITLADQYELTAKLGQGAYGTVFKAIQRSTQQSVAIKVQCLDAADNAEVYAARLGRFERETKLCATLTHPHIVRILEKGQRGRYCFIVFEFVPGETLTHVLRERGALSISDTVLLMGQVLDALESAHAQGVVHRDLKPENLMVVRTATQQYIKVLDFGIGAFLSRSSEPASSLTRSQEILGTPCYSAPEQLRGEPATPKSDIYAWGLVFLECLTGRRVMDGSTMAEVFHRQLSSLDIPLPAALSVHPLGDLLRSALAKDPRGRTADARRLRVALRGLRTTDLVGTIVPANGTPVADTVMMRHRPQREHRHATIVCCTLDVNALDAAASDIETLDAIQRDQLGLCADVAARFGGQTVGALGNRLIVAFGVPKPSDSDARRAARAALEMTSRIESRRSLLCTQRGVDLELHIGIHTDTVVVDSSGSLSGPALNVAARLEGLSQRGVPLVSKATYTFIHRHLRLQPATRGPDTPALSTYNLLAEREADALHAQPGGGVVSAVVGRDHELAVLRDYLRSALSGQGQVVLLRGEAGIGKSRLAHELRRLALAAGAVSLEAACLPEDANTALRPLLHMLRQYFAMDAKGQAQVGGMLEKALRESGLDRPEFVAVLHGWLGNNSSIQPAVSNIPSDRQRAILLECLTHILPSSGRERGTVLLLEDLHWCDPTTLDFVCRLAAVASTRPILVLLTARPSFEGVPCELSTIELKRLERGAVEDLIRLTAQDIDLEPASIERIIELTDGVPLFVEELTRAVMDGESTAGVASSAQRLVPASLRELLNSRIDRAGQAKDTAQIAAAIGREFEVDLLRAVSQQDSETLQAQLDTLEQSDLIRHQRQSGGAKYLFRHGLIREAAWESMPSSRKRLVHASIAGELERRVAATTWTDVAHLAWHHEMAGNALKAAEYRLQAGQQSAARSAYREAIEHLNRGVGLLDQVSDSQERDACEIELRNSLGAALVATQGYGAEPVLKTFVRSRELLARSATPLQRFTAVKGLWVFYNARGEYAAASQMIEVLFDLSRRGSTSEFELSAQQAACQTALLVGNFEATVEHSLECDRLVDPTRQREQIARYGVDPWLSALAHECLALTLLGKLARARERLDVGFRALARFDSPNHEASLLAQAAALELLVGSCGPNPRQALEACIARSEAGAAIANKHGLAHAAGYAAVIGAMARAQSGDDASVAALEAAIALWSAGGIRAALSWHHAFLAQGQLAQGNFAAALASADTSLRHCADYNEEYGISEACRVKARVLGETANSSADVTESARMYRRALQLARQQHARWLELRAAYSWCSHEWSREDAESRAALRSAWGWFAESGEALDTDLARGCRGLLQL